MSDICRILVSRGWNYYFEAEDGPTTGFRAEATRGDVRLEARGDTLRHALSRLLLYAMKENGISK